jgi:ribonuclease Z
MMMTMRLLLTLIVVVLFDLNGSAQDLRVTLLGTGFVTPAMDRFGPSTLVQAGETYLLIDCGRGTLQRLFELNVPLKSVDKVFFTHFHSDHTVGFPDFWLTAWMRGRTDVPLNVWGPLGTKTMMDHLSKAFENDVNLRRDATNENGAKIIANDIEEGVVYDRNGVKVTGFNVDHGPIKPAMGFRIDFRGRSVVLSGDTTVSENLIRAAAGSDVLIHEVATTAGPLHATPEQAAEVFAKVKPKLAVFSHIILGPTESASDLLARTRHRYDGNIEVGEDRMVIEIGDSVQVRKSRQ